MSDTFMTFMLLAWLGCTIVMTFRAFRAASPEDIG
jgi:hypothetical protein